jgi:hypothetical protein
VGFKLKGPTPFLPGKADQERLRIQEIRRHVDNLEIIFQDDAKSQGNAYKQKLFREQLRQLHEFGIPENRPQNLRYWHGKLAYDVTEMPEGDREELLLGWAEAHSILIPEEAQPAFVKCDHAGEVLFLSRIASLPDIRWRRMAVSSESCT